MMLNLSIGKGWVAKLCDVEMVGTGMLGNRFSELTNSTKSADDESEAFEKWIEDLQENAVGGWIKVVSYILSWR